VTGGAVGKGASVLSWSGGKDSALALWTMREEGIPPSALLTTITEEDGRVGTHAVRAELVRAQAAAAGLPLVEVPIPAAPSNAVYEERLATALTARQPADPPAALAAPPLAEVETIAFADLFLADIRAYREERLGAIGRATSFPLWGLDTAALARRFVDSGFGATLVCVDTEQLDADFVGRRFDAALLEDLPAGVDPCGENGEFHTFVDSGPIFDRPIAVEVGARTDAGRFVYQDLIDRSAPSLLNRCSQLSS
jgi:uncharacterized protein (TIGR00290 family)